jgi:hypothetical protein
MHELISCSPADPENATIPAPLHDRWAQALAYAA